jgi:hypothetical protein
VGGQVTAVCSRCLLSLSWRMCAAAGGVGLASRRVYLLARCWRRPMYALVLSFVKIAAAAAAALVCLFVVLFVVIDLFIAAVAACLCGWLLRSSRHGTADNDNGDGDDATRLRLCWRRVLGGFGGRPLGRPQGVRWCLDLAAWLAGVWVFDGLPGASRWWRPRCCGTGGRGWARVGG